MISFDTSRSIQILRESLRILLVDSELLIFPGVFWVCQLMLSTIYFSTWEHHAFVALIALPLYLIGILILGYLSQAAIVGSMLLRFAGGDPEVKDGLQVVRQHWSGLVEWTVQVVLKRLKHFAQTNDGGGLKVRAESTSAESYLGVPIAIVEDLPTSQFLERSRELFQSEWGNGSRAVFGIWNAIVLFGGIGLFFFVILSSSFSLSWGMLLLILASGSTLSAVYKAALYRYAVTKEFSEGFSEEVIANAFEPYESAGT